MVENDDPVQRFRTQQQQLTDEVVMRRDTVLNPNQEYDTVDFVEFLRDELLDRMDREENLLYDAIDDATKTDLATAALRETHDELERRVDILESSATGGASLPLELHELSALIVHHIETETKILFPALDAALDDTELRNRLTPFLD